MRHSAFAGLCFLIVACVQNHADRSPYFGEIDAEAKRLMAMEDVKGMALAIVEDGQVVHLAAFGHRNVDRDFTLQTDTIMYGASFTKTAFAYMVLQLVDAGLVDLDRPLNQYLPQPLPTYDKYADLAGDDRWRSVTARHVLTHSTGYANFRWLEEDRRLRFHFEPGERYAYSGEGFNLLQFALEEGLGFDVRAEMQRRVFDRFDMPNTSLQWRPDFAGNLADGYTMDGSFKPHDKRRNVSAAGSMDTTIEDQARMWAGILRGDGLSQNSRSELIRPQLDIASAHQFPTLVEDTDVRARQIGLSAGLGLVTFGHGADKSWFKGGHDRGTGNIVVCQEAHRRCIVLLSNSVRAELIYPDMVSFAFGETGLPWWWEYNRD